MKTQKIHRVYFSFIIGVFVLIGGLIWTWLVFYDGINESGATILDFQESKSFEIELTGKGIAYYKIANMNYNQNVLFVQVLDPSNNIIAEQKIHTKMSVNYFDYDAYDNYVIRITNLSEQKTEFTLEYGKTNDDKLIFPAIPTVSGIIIIMYTVFRKLMNHSIAHP